MLTIRTLPRVFTVVLLSLVVEFSHSQPADLQFEHVTMRDGLSQDIITIAYRDRFGFLWIGTEDGLNRYDGYSVTSYKRNPRDINTLPHNRITGICDYGSEDLLVTTDGGIAIYHRAANIFTPPEGNLRTYGTTASARPLRDDSGQYWMIIKGNTLLRYDPAKGTVVLLDPAGTSVAGEEIKDLYIDSKDSVWVILSGTISVYQGDSRNFRQYNTRYRHQNTGQQITNLSLTKDPNGNLWIATNGGIFRYDRARELTLFVPLGFRIDNAVVDRDMMVGGLCWDRRGRLWIGGFNGLYCFSPSTNSTSRYAHNPNNPMSLQSNRIYNILLDDANVLWIGTWWGGLSKTDLKKERFGHYRHSTTTPLAGGSNDITAIWEYPRSTFWFTGLYGGVTRINFRTNDYRQFPNQPGNKSHFPSGEISSLTGDTAGNIWIAVAENVAKYQTKAGTFSVMDIPANRGRKLQIQILYADRRGALWMGIQAFGIVRYELIHHAFTYFTFEGNDTSSNRITGAWMFFEDREGNLWAGGWGGNNALLRYDRESDQFKRVPKQELNSSRTVVEDHDGNFWVGTWGLGMSRFNPQTGALQQYLEQDGLPSNFVKGILRDDRGNLWVSTERGLSRYTPSTGTFRNYSTSDGLQGNFFYTGSCLKGSDGRLYFGGANGFNAFYPDSIREEEYSPPVLLTDFRVFDKTRPFDRHVSLVKHITLPYHEDMFSFEYVALDFSSPHSNRYAYKLEGYDHDWIQAGSRRYASYTHLDPGDYLFSVKGTNSDGVWSAHIASIRLTISPAFWQTWWFRIALALAVVALLYAVYRYRLNQLLEVERTRSAIATDLHDDIGTSLTNIALFSDLAQRDVKMGSLEVSRHLEKISHTSRSLLDSMNDIVWSIKPENDALEQTILRMEDYAVDLLEENGIDLHVQIPDQLKTLKLPMTSRRNLFLIFKEAIGNILKHARATHVDVTIVSAVSNKRMSALQVSISDNGKGFDSSAQKHGNGLKNMELRAGNLGGTVTVRSAENNGTTVEILFPLKSPI